MGEKGSHGRERNGWRKDWSQKKRGGVTVASERTFMPTPTKETRRVGTGQRRLGKVFEKYQK